MRAIAESFRTEPHEGFSAQKSADLEKNDGIRYVPGEVESSTFFCVDSAALALYIT